MSPTYWTSSLIIAAARRNDWTIIPVQHTGGPWSIRKGPLLIEIQERRDGGLAWCSLLRTFEGGADHVLLPQHHRGKRQTVLDWLAGNIDWRALGLREH